MNKQEVIEYINELPVLISSKESGSNAMISKYAVLELVEQINEPQKVIIPKFVADKIEYCKETYDYSLFRAMNYCYMHIGSDAAEWLEYNEEIFSSAWFDGYDIEQEKLYEVIIPHTNNYKNQKQYLVKQGKRWFFCGNDVNRFKYQFTKGQIEAAGFGWAFEQGFVVEAK